MKSKVIATVIYILLAVIGIPAVLFEYLMWFVFWAGDGTFTFIAMPITFAIYLTLLLVFKKRYKQRFGKFNIAAIIAIIILTPILSGGTVELIAWLFGIPIVVA